MAEDALLEPIKAYNSIYKQAVNDEANRYFDELVTKASVNVEENRATIKKLKQKQNELRDIQESIAGVNTGKGFAIFGIVISFLAALIGIFLIFGREVYPLYISIPMIPVGILLGVLLILLIVKKINPKLNLLKNDKSKLEDKIKELTLLATSQMDPLNNLYDWNMATHIIEKVIPILDFDKYFDGSKYQKLNAQYGLGKLLDDNKSVTFVQSGNILGNPFLFQEMKIHEIYDKAYSGSITISWTEYYYDSKGNRRSRTRTQVLTATTYHPAPRYTKEKCLIYGNHAAPDLSFSRSPNKLGSMEEKKLKKYVEKNQGDLYKRAEKSLSSGSKNVFTPLANTEFELMFDALNRDHDVQFRLLFTPLAQRNMKQVLTSKEGYGDDFYFYKKNRINVISSRHLQSLDLSGSPYRFISIDIDDAKSKFVNYVNDFFKNIYFDFAPLLSIPLYQQMKSIDYIYGEDAPSNYSSYEHEVIANSFKKELLMHEESITDVIYKTEMIRKDGKSDKFRVYAYSYKGEERVDYVSKMGGDGYLHTIPVYWTEYIPVEQVNEIELKNISQSRNNFNNVLQGNELRNFIIKNSKDGYYSFQRGLLGILLNPHYSYSYEDDKELDKIFSAKD